MIIQTIMKFHNKPVVAYVPHGIDDKLFFPINQGDEKHIDVEKLRHALFKDKNADIEFVLFYNSRNIRRKMIPDIILAFKTFCEVIGKPDANKCALLLHTQPIDENGTNLFEVVDALCPNENIFFTSGMVDFVTLNYLYNIADVTVCVGSNEGWGLSFTESVMAGTPVISNVTGGLQDQLRFEDSDGNWIEFSSAVPSNHTAKYTKHGIWGIPVFPSNRSIQGSVPTPYIFDDRVAFEDLAMAIKKWYDTKPDFRETAGQLGRTWMMSDESRMSADKMGEGAIKCMNHVFNTWEPKQRFELLNTKGTKYKAPNPGIMVDHKKLIDTKNGK